MQPPELNTLDEYGQRFADATYWRPYVEEVCARHQLTPCATVRCHNPGTCPVFIVDERWVVKFFGELFNGAAGYAAEYEANYLISAYAKTGDHVAINAIPVPMLLTSGYLMPDGAHWRWPYLVFEYVPHATSLGEMFDQISLQDRSATARQLGVITHRVHNLPLDSATVLRPTWDTYADMLARQRPSCSARHHAWHALPDHLIAQIDSFLESAGPLFNPATRPHLLHGDITGDHVLGHFTAEHWTMRCLIDFGDAIVGDPIYEIIPLQFDCFRCDTRLLAAYLDAYGPGCQAPPRRALSLALLHPFNMFEGVARHHPEMLNSPTLDELAATIFSRSNF
jgi:hygromycin-B 7''-O-kinase